MAGRILEVTSSTTLDYVEAGVRGPDWREDGTAVLNVRTPTDDPDAVALDFELDATAVDRLDQHAHSLTFTSEQARTLVAALEEELTNDGSERPRRLQD